MADHTRYLEIVLMPLVLALVGFAGTYFITQQQRHATDVAAALERQRADASAAASRQVELLDIFADKIVSENENERALAIYSTLSLDLDLAAKLLPAFLIHPERSERLDTVLSSVTEALILRRVAKPGSAPPIAGRWFLLRHDRLFEEWDNWLEIEADGAGRITVEGAGWRGVGKLDGDHGHYDWCFDGAPTRTGRTDIHLDDSGILFGRVKGSGLDWAYWAFQITNPDDASAAVQGPARCRPPGGPRP